MAVVMMCLRARGADFVSAPSDAEDCEIVGFGAAAGENDFGGLRAEQRGDGFAGASTAPRARWPAEWIELALPKLSAKNGSIASRTAGSTGVVAL